MLIICLYIDYILIISKPDADERRTKGGADRLQDYLEFLFNALV